MNRIVCYLSTLFLAVALLAVPQSLSAQTIPAWTVGTSYAVGAQVTYNGSTYQCLQANTAQPGWDPVDAPALWKLVTASSCKAAPSVPTGLGASGTTSSGTVLKWTAATVGTGCTVSSYTVYKNAVALATVTSGTSYTVSGLTASTTYKFTVAASDAAGTSAQSASVSVTTLAPAKCTTLPPVPAGVTASGTTATGTTLSWTADTAPANCTISGYTVYQGGSSIGTATSNSFAVSGLTASTTYSFTVAATDGAGASAQSSAYSVTTPPAGGGGTTTGTIGFHLLNLGF